ncbi:MAG: hypothetical protein ABFD50_11600 [Smithella sp.]
MADYEILSGMKTLTADELMDCYQAAFDRLEQHDKDNLLDCIDQLLPIKNMGVVSAWELLSKLGIVLMDRRV